MCATPWSPHLVLLDDLEPDEDGHGDVEVLLGDGVADDQLVLVEEGLLALGLVLLGALLQQRAHGADLLGDARGHAVAAAAAPAGQEGEAC